MVATLLIVALMAAFLSIPTMIAARIVGAGNTGFAPCFAATFLAVVITHVTEAIMPTQILLASAVQFIASAALFTLLLRASLFQGALVAILLLVIQVGAIAGFSALGHAYLGHA